MSCCGSEISEEPNGECPDCGGDTFDGESVYICYYSPLDCETCGAQPCDGSC